jgi:hypothetical protein
MTWPYHMVELTHEQKHERRLMLDRYGVYAQLSALVPIIFYQLYRLGVWVYSERQRSKVRYSAVPSSPTLKRSRNSTAGGLVKQWRQVAWWLESEVAPGWGLRGQWIATGTWISWLLFLCIHKTGIGTYLNNIFLKLRSLARSCPLSTLIYRLVQRISSYLPRSLYIAFCYLPVQISL